MIYEFEIVMLRWHHNRGDFIFARHLGKSHDFDIPEGSVFGDTPVYHYKDMYPMHDAKGNPRFDLFVLRPVSMSWLEKGHFEEGQRVKLLIE